MDVSKYPRDKIGLLIKIVRIEQGLERIELAERTGISVSRLFQIENNQSILNNYEISLIFRELLIDGDMISQKDDYIIKIFDEYVDNYIFGLKSDNNLLIQEAKNFETEFESSLYYYKWVCLKYFDGVITKQINEKLKNLEFVINKVIDDFTQIDQQICGIFLSLQKSRECKYRDGILILCQSLNINNNKMLGMIYYHLFTNYTQINESELAYSYLIKALDQFKLENNFIRITECICHLGVYSSRKRAYKLAEAYFIEAIKLAKVLKQENIIGICYYNLSWCKLCEKEYSEVYSYVKQAQQYIEDGNLYFNIAFAYYKQHKDKDIIYEYIKKGQNKVNKNYILYDEFKYLEYVLDHTKEESINYIYNLLLKIEKKANRDDYYLLYTELLDLLEELHKTEEIVIIQKRLMEL